MIVSEAPVKAQTQPQPHYYGWQHHLKKLTVTWARWLHIYLSMVSFGILLFFAATGLTVNHPEWFASQQKTVVLRGQAPLSWLRPPAGKDIDKLQIVEQLRRQHGIHSAFSDFRVDDAQLSVGFKGPGYTADAFIDRDTVPTNLWLPGKSRCSVATDPGRLLGRDRFLCSRNDC